MASADIRDESGLVFQVTGIFPMSDDSMVFNPTVSTEVVSASLLFESVELVSFRVLVHAPPSSTGHVEGAFVEGGADFELDDDLNQASRYPSHRFSFLAPHDATNVEFNLGDAHSFSRELKTLSVGNESPAFVVKVDGAPATSRARVRIQWHLTLSGRGLKPRYHTR